jgi:GMP synthase-like glutamine amidotransferase
MDVLVIMHHPDEGPGTIGGFLDEAGAHQVVVRLFAGDALPEDLGAFGAILSMGGPMNVYEEDKYPWLAAEDRLLKQAAAQDIPTLGVCLGSQLIAKALGAAVTRADAEEVGWFSVDLTPEGSADPLLAGLGPSLEVFQWHGDTFALPAGGRLVAKGDLVPHQAYGHGRLYGLQFHVEVTPAILSNWFKDDPRLEGMLEYADRRQEALDRQARRIYQNFWALAT